MYAIRSYYVILPEHFPPHITTDPQFRTPDAAIRAESPDRATRQKQELIRALETAGGNQSEVA